MYVICRRSCQTHRAARANAAHTLDETAACNRSLGLSVCRPVASEEELLGHAILTRALQPPFFTERSFIGEVVLFCFIRCIVGLTSKHKHLRARLSRDLVIIVATVRFKQIHCSLVCTLEVPSVQECHCNVFNARSYDSLTEPLGVLSFSH
jgi:hypothetical protein